MMVGKSMDSIFSQLFTYRPTPGRTPQEDYFTEAFAAVLKASLPLRIELVQYLICQDVDSVHVETQRTLDGDGGRLDLWIDAHNRTRLTHHVVGVENKIKAGEGSDQLRRYEAHLKGHATADTRTLVYATLHERSTFQPSRSGVEVSFRQIHWFQIAGWMKEFVTNHAKDLDDRTILFVRELLLLMEEWNMTMSLDAHQLAAACIYHRSASRQLLNILDETKEACGLAGTSGNQWSHNREYLYYSSPWADDQEDIYIEFAFDFHRDDVDFSVPQLSLPSAYFAVIGTHRTELDALQNWEPPPEDWNGGRDPGHKYLLVKRLASLRAHNASLHAEYLNFFRTARDELWRVIGGRDLSQ